MAVLKYGGTRNLRRADPFHRRVNPSIEDDIQIESDDELFADYNDSALPPRSTTLIILEPVDSNC